jgi:hypothetical protein
VEEYKVMKILKRESRRLKRKSQSGKWWTDSKARWNKKFFTGIRKRKYWPD